MPDTPQRTTAFEYLAKLASLLALFYALLFFYGWVYLVYEYGAFHIDVWMLDIPIYNFPAISVFALLNLIEWSEIPLLIIFGIGVLLSIIRNARPGQTTKAGEFIKRWV